MQIKNSDILRLCYFLTFFCHLKKKKGTWREKKNERNEKTGGRGEGQDANTVVTVVDGCAAGQPNGLRWDTSAKEVRKKAGIFPGRLPLHVHAHTNAANTHAHIISLLLSTQLVMLTLFPHISYSVSCLCFCPLPFSITPSSFLLFYFSLAALPLHSFHFPFSPCLLHSPLPFSSVPISVSPSPPPLQSPSVALVRTQTGTKGKETSLGVALILLTLTWQH